MSPDTIDRRLLNVPSLKKEQTKSLNLLNIRWRKILSSYFGVSHQHCWIYRSSLIHFAYIAIAPSLLVTSQAEWIKTSARQVKGEQLQCKENGPNLIYWMYMTYQCEVLSQIGRATRLNSSHTVISYAVFCLQKKKNKKQKRFTFREWQCWIPPCNRFKACAPVQ